MYCPDSVISGGAGLQEYFLEGLACEIISWRGWLARIYSGGTGSRNYFLEGLAYGTSVNIVLVCACRVINTFTVCR